MIAVEDKKDTLASDIVISKDYDSEKNISKIVEDVFMDMVLQENKFSLTFVDSVFRKSYPHIDEISYYSLKLLNNDKSIDSISYGKKKLVSPFKIDISLGSKKIYHFKAYFNLKPSAQIRNMLFSIGITSIAVIFVAFLIIAQLLQLRKKTVQLLAREKSVSGIVHDLKSPLSYVYTMLGFYETTEKDHSKKQNLNTAKTRVKYLSEKIELILSAVRASSSRLQMNPAPYAFNARCTEIMDELKVIYKDKQIDFELLSSADLMLNVDNVYFEGCIRNLLDNAVKYSPEKVKISVSSATQGNKILLYFKDNGLGIPEKLHKKVFREFYRTSEKGSVKGHGVGLSFTKQIVEAHGGKIYIEKQKEEEKGTTFVIEIHNS